MKEKLRNNRNSEKEGAVIYQLGEYVMTHIDGILKGSTYHSEQEIEHLVRINNTYAQNDLPLVPGAKAKSAQYIRIRSTNHPANRNGRFVSPTEYADLDGDEL